MQPENNSLHLNLQTGFPRLVQNSPTSNNRNKTEIVGKRISLKEECDLSDFQGLKGLGLVTLILFVLGVQRIALAFPLCKQWLTVSVTYLAIVLIYEADGFSLNRRDSR